MLVRILNSLSARIATPISLVCDDIPELLAELKKAPQVTVRIGYRTAAGGTMTSLRSLASTARAIWSSRERIVLFAPGSVHVQRLHFVLAKLMGRRVIAYVPMCFPASTMGYRRAVATDFITRMLGRSIDLWITITCAQQELLQGHFRFHKPVCVVPNAMDNLTVVTSQAPSLKDGRLRVVFLGRYDGWQKGLDWLYRGLQESHEQWARQARFLFFGQGAYRRELEKLAARFKPGDITVNSWTDSSTAFSEADLLLMPSRFEGFPLVFVEAASAGIPILSTSFPGAHALLGEGAWVEFGDTQGLVSALLKMTDEKVRKTVASIQRASLEAQSKPSTFDLAVTDLSQKLQ